MNSEVRKSAEELIKMTADVHHAFSMLTHTFRLNNVDKRVALNAMKLFCAMLKEEGVPDTIDIELLMKTFTQHRKSGAN